MPFDSFMTSAIASEMKKMLIGVKVDKICQPEKDEIDLVFNISGRKRLIINCSANNSYLALSSNAKENPVNPPMTCMLLRKHLSRAKITDIQQLQFDRVVKISFSAGDEMGFVNEKHIYCEMMGRGSNFIFTDENETICASLRQNDLTTKFERIVMVGAKYAPMPLMNKFNPLEFDENLLKNEYKKFDSSMPLEKAVSSLFYGFGKLTAREIAFRVCGDCDGTVSDADFGKFLSEIIRLKEIVRNEEFSPVLIYRSKQAFESREAPIDFSFTDISQFGSEFYIQKCESVSEAIENYYLQKDTEERKKQHYNDIFVILKNCRSRLEKKIILQKEELEKSKDFEKYKLYGDLIISNLYRIKEGQSKAEVENFYSDECEKIIIPLDKRFSPSRNAQIMYKEYAKKKTAIEKMQEQISIAETELEYVKSVTCSLKSASTQSDIAEIREELSHWNYGRRLVSKLKKPSAKNFKVSIHKIISPSGNEVLIGHNNLQNDKITFSLADKNDMWFHVKKYHGSHVVLRCNSENGFSDEDIFFAAKLAAENSEVSGNAKVEVDYTPIKYVKKPNGAKYGFVTYKTNKSITVVS